MPALALASATTMLLVAGCTTAPQAPVLPEREQSCLAFYQAMDRAVASARVRDAGARVITGYPYLRVDRFLASYSDQLADAKAYRTWLDATAEIDLRARRLELANLPPAWRAKLSEQFQPQLAQRLTRCSHLLRYLPAYQSGHRPRLLQAAAVPDNYLTWRRVLGLYPLAEPFALAAIERLQRRLERPFSEPLLQQQGKLLRYQPQERAESEGLSARLQGRPVALDPLGVPQVPADLLRDLFARFSPVLEVDTRNDADRIGRVHWRQLGQVAIDVGDPLVYRFASYTRFYGRALLQLNYLFWFPARDTGDIYAGRFDALLWRVTLDSRWQPLAYDSIHGCGCYYQVFPATGYRVRASAGAAEPVLSPMPAPALTPSQRIRLRLAAGTHYLLGLRPDDGNSAPGVTYTAADYEQLRSLPLPGGGRRSLFAEDGLVPGSERAERFLFWPFGVLSAGAMRQPGTHAIAFVGRRHFDDPYLLEQLLDKAR